MIEIHIAGASGDTTAVIHIQHIARPLVLDVTHDRARDILELARQLSPDECFAVLTVPRSGHRTLINQPLEPHLYVDNCDPISLSTFISSLSCQSGVSVVRCHETIAQLADFKTVS